MLKLHKFVITAVAGIYDEEDNLIGEENTEVFQVYEAGKLVTAWADVQRAIETKNAAQDAQMNGEPPKVEVLAERD